MSVSQPPIPADPALEALRLTFPLWFITLSAFGGCRAEWKSASGLEIRYVAGISIADLHRRLEAIEAARGESEA